MGQELNIILQGIVLHNPSKIAQIIMQAATKQGLKVKGVDETFQVIAPNPEICHIRFGEGGYGSFVPKGKCHVLVGFLTGEGSRMAAEYLAPEGTVIMNTRDIKPILIFPPYEKYPEEKEILDLLSPLPGMLILLDAVAIANEAGDRYAVNFVMLGAMAGAQVLPISTNVLKETMKELVPEHDLETSLKAFDLGLKAVSK